LPQSAVPDPVDGPAFPPAATAGQPLRLAFASADRFYDAVLTQDLFGTWVVVQSWCGRFTRRGGAMTKPVANFTDGKIVLDAILRQRLQRGYQLQPA
jgi:hypothetical protein